MTSSRLHRARAAARHVMLAVLILAPVSCPAVDSTTLAHAAKRVLDERCVACHACYNAPCQLDLSSFEGVARGASTMRVYDGTRLIPIAPTRLGVDARGVDAWRGRGFFSVLEPHGEASPAFSILGRMLAMKRAFPHRRVSGQHDWMCPDDDVELAVYSSLGHDGMPYGLPGLGEARYRAVTRWLADGAHVPADPDPPLAPEHRQELEAWERFLNDPDPRHRLVARYLYEHLFLAHVFVDGTDPVFHRLVRSATAPPHPVEEIATVRPFDDPGDGPFHYRFLPVRRALVHKTHITFELSSERLERYRRWFLDGSWSLDAAALPDYDPVSSANPFKTFAAMPARARYRFLLDNARYFVMSFIRGPVCEGQMAVNVINDHFHVLFLHPSRDLSVTDRRFLDDSGALLSLPSAGRSDPFETYYLAYKKRQRDYTAYRERRYAAVYPEGMDVAAIWDGGRDDRDAALTVFRHFDNAAVVHGLRGGPSKTVWVMDYPIFERIYYLLVAGFNVYGNAFHQASTRLYMDNLRVESEDLFLSFLPPQERTRLRERWYRGMLARLKMGALNPLRGARRPTRIDFDGADPKQRFEELVAARLGPALLDPEPRLNVMASQDRIPPGEPSRAAVEARLNGLTGKRAPFVSAMPELSYLLVEFDDGTELYALVRNREHLNVAFLFDESDRRVPEEDTLAILKGVAGSYPNFLFTMQAREVGAFVQLLEGWTGRPRERRALEGSFGVSRHRPDFWRHYDRLHDAVLAWEGRDGARLDLSKYDLR